MRNQLKIVYSALTMVAMLGLTSTVHGVPSFARQTGLDCNSCHAPIGFPVLNAFGQAFRAGGYTQASEDNLLGDGEALSIPKTLNLSVVAKMRTHFISKTKMGQYDKTATGSTANFQAVAASDGGGKIDNSKTTSVGYNKSDLPDEWAIWLGGRAGKHVGFATEFGINPDGADYAFSFKMPIVYDVGPVKLGAVPYWTDAQGPGWGFETLSTGAVGNIKMFEGKTSQNARQYIGDVLGTGSEAAGLGLYVWHPMGFVYYSPYLESKGGSATDAQFAHNIRVAVTPSFAGIDMAVGFQWMFGNYGTGGAPDVLQTADGLAYSSSNPYKNGGALASKSRTLARVDYLGFDAQVMGTLGIPVMLVFTYGQTDQTKNTKGLNKAGDKINAWSLLLNATVIEDLLNVGAGVRMANIDSYIEDTTVAAKANGDITLIKSTYLDVNGAKTTQKTLTDNQLIGEVKFNLARNLRLSLTGYYSLNAVDVATDKGFITATTRGSTSGLTTTTGVSQEQEHKLTAMLFGGF
jgi:hypothetical protein